MPEKRSLWIFNHYAATRDQAGGSRHADLATALGSRGWESEVFACSFDHVSRTYTVETSWRRPILTQTYDGVPFHWIHSTPYPDNSWRRYLNMLVFSTILLIFSVFRGNGPNAILGSSAHLLTPFVGWIVARRYHARCVLEVRDLWPDSLIQLGLESKPIVGVLRWMEKFLYRRSDVLVGVSQGIVQGIVRNGGDPGKTVLISHGIEPNLARRQILQERQSIRGELGWGDEFVVLWAGSMEPFNALDVVVAAGEMVADLPVRIVLLGGGSTFDELSSRSTELKNVDVLPSVPRREAFRWMVAADAGLLVARPFESFTGTRPRKIFDYMAAELPILCFVPGEASQVILEADAGIVREWATAETVAEVIRWGVNSKQDLLQLGKNGRNAVETTYSLDHAAELLDRNLRE